MKYFKPLLVLILIIMDYKFTMKYPNIFRYVTNHFNSQNYKNPLVKGLEHFSLCIMTLNYFKILKVHFL